MRRLLLILTTVALSSLLLSGAAQAIVVDMNALGQTSVPFNASDQSGYVGVSLVPGACSDLPSSGTCGALANVGIPNVTSAGPCADPALAPDLVLPDTGICFNGGNVMTRNETFALTWDAQRAYWSGTRGYVEQFLRDVADGSGTLTSPYALTSQYVGRNGRALNSSTYGGGCIDYGSVGGSACEFGSPTGAGHDFPSNGCQPQGNSFTSLNLIGTNSVCLTDSQLQGELATMIGQTGMLGRTQPGYSPLVTLLLPPGVESCLDAGNKLCSANGNLTPPPPIVTTSATGGTVAPGAYEVEITYVTASGESAPSASANVSVLGSTSSSGGGSSGSGGGSSTGAPTSTITIDSPPPANGATGWYVYITQPGGTTFSRQAGPLAIGTPLTITAPPTSGGAAPPSPLSFCSYHSQVNVAGTEVPYLVQPWTAGTACDEPDISLPSADPTPQELSLNAGMRLVSPLSRSHIAAIVNPGLNGWFALDGMEIDDNGGCVPLAGGLDSVSFGNDSYLLQREFNNAGVMESEPYTYEGCAPNVVLSPNFVVPSSVTQGDEVQFDGSTTASTLIVPNGGYRWNFGDGTTAVGASVVHTFKTAGNYSVTLQVTDRGGNVGTISQTIQVLQPNGQPAPPSSATQHLQARIQLVPQSLHQVLHGGIAAVLSSNTPADGLASVLISRAAAKRAHIKAGRGPSVVIGRGTVAGIKDGVITLHLRLSRAITAKLARLRQVKLTIHLMLITAGGGKLTIDVAGNY